MSQKKETVHDSEINDKAYEIDVLNSNRFNPKEFARCTLQPSDTVEKSSLGDDIDMAVEQAKDEILMELKIGMQNDEVPKAVQRKHILVENIMFYISDADTDPKLRFYVPVHLRDMVIRQSHDLNGHMGIEKIFDAIKQNYYWPNLFKELYEYVSRCVLCQMRNMKKIKPPVQPMIFHLVLSLKLG